MHFLLLLRASRNEKGGLKLFCKGLHFLIRSIRLFLYAIFAKIGILRTFLHRHFSFSSALHRKKSFSIFPSPSGVSLTRFSLGGNNIYMTSLFPPRESLVSDIPAGDGNLEKLFYGVFTKHTNSVPFIWLLLQGLTVVFATPSRRAWTDAKSCAAAGDTTLSKQGEYSALLLI